MNRYFKVELETLNFIRQQVMEFLEQPNDRADEPWPIDGTFNDGEYGYVALGSHHTTGDFADLIEGDGTPENPGFINLEGVEEIDEITYTEAAPQIETPE